MTPENQNNFSLIRVAEEKGLIDNGNCNIGHLIEALGAKEMENLIEKVGYNDAYMIYSYRKCDEKPFSLAKLRCKKIVQDIFENAIYLTDLLEVMNFSRILIDTDFFKKRFNELLDQNGEMIRIGLDILEEKGCLCLGSVDHYFEKLSLKHSNIMDVYRAMVALYKKMLDLQNKIWHQKCYTHPRRDPKKPFSQYSSVFEQQLIRSACMAKNCSRRLFSSVGQVISNDMLLDKTFPNPAYLNFDTSSIGYKREEFG